MAHLANLPEGIHPEDVFNDRGMPIRLIPPPSPPGERLIFMVGQRGGFHWYNVTTRQVYQRQGVIHGIPRVTCSTLTFSPRERPRRGPFEDDFAHQRYLCQGQMVPAVEHNRHVDGISLDVLLQHLFDMAMRATLALYGARMTKGQIYLFADYFSRMILQTPFNETWIELFPKKYHDLAVMRSMYPDEYRRFRERMRPIMDHRISDVPSLAEAAIRFLWARGGEIVDIIQPPIPLSHPGSRELGLPDPQVPYELILAVPGNFSFYFSLEINLDGH